MQRNKKAYKNNNKKLACVININTYGDNLTSVLKCIDKNTNSQICDQRTRFNVGIKPISFGPAGRVISN